MAAEKIHTVVIGGGQAGLAASAHLSKCGVSHVVLERKRIAERWRSERWDSLVANGPAWHDRFPAKTFDQIDPDGFATRDMIVEYFENFAKDIHAPVRSHVEVKNLTKAHDDVFHLETSSGEIEAKNVIVATGPFQKPIIPTAIPKEAGFHQIHSST